jgi:hypothetical protein
MGARIQSPKARRLCSVAARVRKKYYLGNAAELPRCFAVRERTAPKLSEPQLTDHPGPSQSACGHYAGRTPDGILTAPPPPGTVCDDRARATTLFP